MFGAPSLRPQVNPADGEIAAYVWAKISSTFSIKKPTYYRWLQMFHALLSDDNTLSTLGDITTYRRSVMTWIFLAPGRRENSKVVDPRR